MARFPRTGSYAVSQAFIFINLNLQVMAHLMQVHKSITTLQGEDIVFLATDINLPGKSNAVALQFEENQITFQTNSFNRVDEGNVQFFIYFSFVS